METARSRRSHIKALLAGFLVMIFFGATLPQAASAATAYDINRQVDAALSEH